jgi:hypothetical protein
MVRGSRIGFGEGSRHIDVHRIGCRGLTSCVVLCCVDEG